jgi:hypothetical protein
MNRGISFLPDPPSTAEQIREWNAGCLLNDSILALLVRMDEPPVGPEFFKLNTLDDVVAFWDAIKRRDKMAAYNLLLGKSEAQVEEIIEGCRLVIPPQSA